MAVSDTFRRQIPWWSLLSNQKITKFSEPIDSGRRLLLHVNWQVPVQ